jgi:hypothetical protein
VFVDWGPRPVGERFEHGGTDALVVVREEDFADLPDWIAELQERKQHASKKACRYCYEDPFPGTVERIVGDSPEVCAADHKPPRWGEFTACCGVRVGTSFGYKHGVRGTIGLGGTGAIARGLARL